MAQAKFDIAEQLHLYFRVANAQSKTFTFVNTDESAFDISALSFQLNIMAKKGADELVLQLTEVNGGLAVVDNTLIITVDETDSDIPANMYFWELYDSAGAQTWLWGNCHFTNSEPAEVTDSEPITVNLEPDTVIITISNSANITEIDGGLVQ